MPLIALVDKNGAATPANASPLSNVAQINSTLGGTPASLIVGITVDYKGGPGPSTLTDDQGNGIYTPLALENGGAFLNIRIHYKVAPNTATVHKFSTAVGTYCAMRVYAFSNVALVSVVDTESVGGYTTSLGTVKPGAQTPLTDGCVLITGEGHLSDTTSQTIDGGFLTPGDISGPIAGQACMCAGSYLIQTLKTLADPTWTGSSGERGAVMASFKVGSAPPPGGVTYTQLERGIRGLGRGLVLRSGQ